MVSKIKSIFEVKQRVVCFNKDKAFTLLELLIVVAIIGLLIAIAIPAFQGIIARGRISTMEASLAGLPEIIAMAEERPAPGPTGFCTHSDVVEIISALDANAGTPTCTGTENAAPTCLAVGGIPNVEIRGITVTHLCGDYRGGVVLNGRCLVPLPGTGPGTICRFSP